MWTGGGGWLAKCGRLFGKKIIDTIFVKFTQINEIFSFSRWWFWNTCIFVWPIMPVFLFGHLLHGQPHLLQCYYQNCLTHVFTSSIRMISFFTLQCEFSTSCNVSYNASLVSAQTGGVGVVNQMWKGLDRERGSQKIPNLCGHSLWMTPKTNICGKLGVWSNLVKSFEKFSNENAAIFSKVVAN